MKEPLIISAVLREVARLNAVHNAPAPLVTLRRNCRAAHPTTVTSIRKLVRRGLIYKRYGKEEYFLRDEGEALDATLMDLRRDIADVLNPKGK